MALEILANTTANYVNWTIWVNDGPPTTGTLTPDNGVPGWMIIKQVSTDTTWVGLTGLTPALGGNVCMQPNDPAQGATILLMRTNQSSADPGVAERISAATAER